MADLYSVSGLGNLSKKNPGFPGVKVNKSVVLVSLIMPE